MPINIETYERKERLQGTAGNVIVQPSNSYREIEGLGENITQIGRSVYQQITQAQYYNEKTKALLEIDKAYQQYTESLDPNDTSKWVTGLESVQETLPDRIKVKSNRLKSELPVMLEEAKLRQRTSLVNYQRVIDARNIGREYQANQALSIQALSQMPEDTPPATFEDKKAEYVESLYGFKRIDPTKPVESGNLEPSEDFDNPAFISDAVRKKEFEIWLGNVEEERDKYFTQEQYKRGLAFVQAEMNTEASIKAIDEAIDKGGKWDLFPRLDTGHLQSLRVNAQSAISRKKQEMRALAEQLEDNITNALIQGKLTIPVDGEEQNIKDAIVADENLDSATKRTLSNMYNNISRGIGTRYTDEEKLEAYVNVMEETDPEKKRELLFKNAGALGSTKAMSIYDGMKDPVKSNDTILPGIIGSVSAMESYTVGELKKAEGEPKAIKEKIGTKGLEFTKLKADLIKQDEELQKKGATAEQRLAAAEKLIAPAKEEIAKEIVKQSPSKLWGLVGLSPVATLIASRSIKKKIEELKSTPKPTNKSEFLITVSDLKSAGKEEEARAYYDKWYKTLWP